MTPTQTPPEVPPETPSPTTPDEAARLSDLRALRVLDTPPERRFDELVEAAKRRFDVPVAYLAVIDADRQWFKAKAGVSAEQTPRKTSMCDRVVRANRPVIATDTAADPRFHDHPMVTGEAGLRFYAGYPLRSPNGAVVATLCVADRRPRSFSAEDEDAMARLASLAEAQLHLVDVIGMQRQTLAMKRQLEKELAEAEEYVRSFLPPQEVAIDATERPDYRFLASSQLGGDLLGFYGIDDDHFGVFLLDVTGHGVGSSLLSVSINNALRNARTFADPLDPSDVLGKLNDAFPMEQHANKFTTVWYGVYRRSTRELRYGAAGHHPALLFRAGGAVESLGSPALMIGVSAGEAYTASSATLGAGDRLYLFSDGLFEVRNAADELLGFHGLQELMGKPFHPELPRVQQVIDRVAGYAGFAVTVGGEGTGAGFDDDVSLLEVEFA